MISSVKVGPQRFKVEFRLSCDDGMLNDDTYGYTLDQGNLIVIAADISEGKQKVTLLHEVLHAARMVFEGASTPKDKAEHAEWEHHFIGIYETALLLIFQDNPDLMAWLSN